MCGSKRVKESVTNTTYVHYWKLSTRYWLQERRWAVPSTADKTRGDIPGPSPTSTFLKTIMVESPVMTTLAVWSVVVEGGSSLGSGILYSSNTPKKRTSLQSSIRSPGMDCTRSKKSRSTRRALRIRKQRRAPRQQSETRTSNLHERGEQRVNFPARTLLVAAYICNA